MRSEIVGIEVDQERHCGFLWILVFTLKNLASLECFIQGDCVTVAPIMWIECRRTREEGTRPAERISEAAQAKYDYDGDSTKVLVKRVGIRRPII